MRHMMKLDTAFCYKKKNVMDWIKIETEQPPPFKKVLVLKRYLDSCFDFDTGGYDNSKIFWTALVPTIDCIVKTIPSISWRYGGQAVYWCHYPDLPHEEE
jgi:hypothetical protein